MKKLLVLLVFVLFGSASLNSQCDIQTTNRPDGIIMKYFIPRPVIRTSAYEVGISIYKNINTNSYMLSVSVLFVEMSPKDLTNDLVIQTTNDNGITLNQILTKQITMNGRVLANAMYSLDERDFSELSQYKLKSIFFYLGNNLEGSTVTENSNILTRELNCLKNN